MILYRLSPPNVTAQMTLPRQPAGPERVRYFTVGSKDGTRTYRVRASVETGHPNRVLLAATSLADVTSMLHRLLLVELLVTLAVLTAVAVLGLWVVRLGLEPRRKIEATAAEIAAGDLSRRVENRPAPGGGAAFVVTLPLARREARRRIPAAAPFRPARSPAGAHPPAVAAARRR